MQTVSGDAQGRFSNSLTNIHFPNRNEFLIELGTRMAGANTLASIEDIERLWFELQREIAESGKVVRFNTTITLADGEETQMDVVRVGTFNIVFDDGYLQYESGTGRISELQRQPEQGRYTNSAGDMVDASSGTVEFGLDVTRGQILGACLSATGRA